MNFRLMFLAYVFVGVVKSQDICPVSIDPLTSVIKIDTTAFAGFNTETSVGAAGGRAGQKGQKGEMGAPVHPGSDCQFQQSYDERFQAMEEAIEYLGKGWRTIGKYRVWFSETTMSFNAAEKLCQSKEARLVAGSIRNSTTRSFVFEIVGDRNVHTWIGLNDIHIEGRYVWSDGEIFNQSDLWQNGAPNNWENQDCVRVDIPALKLNDFECSQAFKAICEIDVV